MPLLFSDRFHQENDFARGFFEQMRDMQLLLTAMTYLSFVPPVRATIAYVVAAIFNKNGFPD